jgi:hypothetical protein
MSPDNLDEHAEKNKGGGQTNIFCGPNLFIEALQGLWTPTHNPQ